MSPAIQVKAEELEYDPVKIYHWVRNNVDWLPSWAATQNADLTLSAKRGNAMDIASLTLSLLRASQIPSRYVHGTIEVPANEFMNWAGGFSDINAAMNYAASAGIPVTGIISGGVINHVQLEHVWVEAAIDYFPSRGAKNLDADTWLSMDPSFKQFEFLEGLDVVSITGLDTEQLANDFVATGTVNEAEGWATGFDPLVLQNTIDQAQTQLEDYIENTLNDPTVGDVIGGRKTIVKEYPTLPSSLPNRIVTRGNHYDEIPSQLQQKVKYSLGTDLFGYPLNSITLPFSKVNNQKITLSFKPASQADEDALAALLPEGEITDLSQLPDSIPSYLIRVIPELKVNAEVVQTGSSMNLGEELGFVTQVQFAGNQNLPSRTYNVVAGSFLAVSATSGSIAPGSLEDVQTRMESTKTILETEDPDQIGNLGREDILGDMFQAGVLGYYGQAMALNNLMGLQADAHQNIIAGTGTVGYEPNVSYFFGMPQSIEAGGVALNIPFVQASATTDGDAEKRKLYNLQTGMLMSALEHLTPEQMFAEEDPNEPQPDAISAVKALQIASETGQRIYQITQANMADTLPNIHHSLSTMDEIRSALNAGKEVTTHTDAVSVPGWSGAGYLIVDPETGTGAYKISGGNNGGKLPFNTDPVNIDPGALLYLVLSIFVTPAHASDPDDGANADFTLALIDLLGALSGIPVFGPISILLGALGNVNKIGLACDMGPEIGNIGVLVLLSIASIAVLAFFSATTLLGIFAIVFFGYIFSVLIDFVVDLSINHTCTDEE